MLSWTCSTLPRPQWFENCQRRMHRCRLSVRQQDLLQPSGQRGLYLQHALFGLQLNQDITLSYA